jgi:hypothetical protein
LLGALVVVAVAGWRAAWVAASISAQGSYGGPLLASGPRWSRRPDWDTRGPSPLEPPSCSGEGNRVSHPTSAAMGEPSTQAIPGAVSSSGTSGGRRPGAAAAGRSRRSGRPGRRCGQAAVRLPIHGSGRSGGPAADGRQRQSRSLTGHGVAKATKVAWRRCLRAVRWQTRWSRHRARSRSARTPGGQPDLGTRSRRHSSGQHPGVDPVGRAGQRGQALDLVGVGDGDRPAGQLELVMDEAGAVHRPGRRPHRLPMSSGLAGQPTQPIGIWWCGGDLDGAALGIQQVHVQPVA